MLGFKIDTMVAIEYRRRIILSDLMSDIMSASAYANYGHLTKELQAK
jgi:hypothetical protein